MPRQPRDPQQPKRKKSTYGGGSVHQVKDERWRAKFTNPETGKSIVRYAKTEKEAD